MSDTWSNIQAHKKQLDSLRERLQRRRKDPAQLSVADGGGSSEGSVARSDSPAPSAPPGAQEETEKPPDPELEKRLLGYLSDLSLSLPTDSLTIKNELHSSESAVSHSSIQSLLLKFSAQELIEVRQPSSSSSSSSPPTVVVSVDHTKLWAMIGSVGGAQRAGVKRKAEDQALGKMAAGAGFPPSRQSAAPPPLSSISSLTPASSCPMAGPSAAGGGAEKKSRSSKSQSSHLDMEIESLLNQQSTKEQQSKKVSREILELLNASTAKEQSIVEKFRSRGRAQVQEFCDHGTKEDCVRSGDAPQPCTKLHFRTFGMVDGEETCAVVMVYNTADSWGVLIGDSVVIPEPNVKRHSITHKEKTFDFRSIRLDSPLLLIVNGKKQSAQSQIPVSISYKHQSE
ncbi:unnamed protein product [Menidia menidia]|uniref:(Atlantic silverside) hypothetical protein n=1 Tax=Menidia menidia TaxID=238744 RepID=A0A8S4BFL1_9TELE|nr:unnamed protein product [Menidia menidia]